MRTIGAHIRPIVAVLVATITLLGACGDNGNNDTTGVGTAANTAVVGVTVEILYLSHIPAADEIVADVDTVLAEYPGIDITRYDLATPEGQAFADDNATDKPFLNIFVDGRTDHDVDGESIDFRNFPTGRATDDVPAGNWTPDDLRAVLDRLTA